MCYILTFLFLFFLCLFYSFIFLIPFNLVNYSYGGDASRLPYIMYSHPQSSPTPHNPQSSTIPTNASQPTITANAPPPTHNSISNPQPPPPPSSFTLLHNLIHDYHCGIVLRISPEGRCSLGHGINPACPFGFPCC